MSQLSWWIKIRKNPQIGTKYTACGQMSVKDTKAKEKTVYGSNWMERWRTEDGYKERIRQLVLIGERVYDSNGNQITSITTGNEA